MEQGTEPGSRGCALQRRGRDRKGFVLAHYENQTEEEAVAEDEAAYEQESRSMMEIPNELVSKVRKLIAGHKSGKQAD